MKKMTGDDVFRAIGRWPRKDNLSDAQRKAQYRVRMENVRNLSKCAAAEILKMGLWEADLKIPENRKKDMDMIQKDIVRNLPVRPRYTEETINWAVSVMQYLVWQEKSFVDYDQSPNHWAIQGATDTIPGPVLPDPDPDVTTTEWFDRAIAACYGQDLPDPAPQLSTTEWLTKIIQDYNDSNGPHNAHIMDDRIKNKMVYMADKWQHMWLQVRDTAYIDYAQDFKNDIR